MKLTETEKKILILAMDTSASDGETAAAATKFIRSLRDRYKSGYELIKDLDTGDALSSLVTKAAAPQQSYTRPFGGDGSWQDIMRQAQEMGAQWAHQQQAYAYQQYQYQRSQRQQTWDEYVNQAQRAYQAQQKVPPTPPPPAPQKAKSFLEKIFGK